MYQEKRRNLTGAVRTTRFEKNSAKNLRFVLNHVAYFSETKPGSAISDWFLSAVKVKQI